MSAPLTFAVKCSVAISASNQYTAEHFGAILMTSDVVLVGIAAFAAIECARSHFDLHGRGKGAWGRPAPVP